MLVKSKTVTFPGRFAMHRGGHLMSPTLAYETWGTLSSARDNAILIFSGLSPSAHAASSEADPSAGWWEDMIGPGLPLDTERFFVIAVNSLGSCFGSTGPASVNPETDEIYRLTFPVLTMEDIAASAHRVVGHLGVKCLHAVIGCSMGGMSGLAYCVMYPGAAETFVSVSACTRSLPFAIAVRSLQRELIRRDPKWQNGNYDRSDPPLEGQRMARKLGMMTYRSAEEWEQRFGRERATDIQEPGEQFKIDFAIEAYLQSRADQFSGGFDANCYLYLSRASDLFDFSEHGGSLAAAFAKLQLKRTLVIGVTTDILFPLRQQRELAAGFEKVCKDAKLVELDCLRGHDSFLVEMDAFRPVMSEFFEGACR